MGKPKIDIICVMKKSKISFHSSCIEASYVFFLKIRGKGTVTFFLQVSALCLSGVSQYRTI